MAKIGLALCITELDLGGAERCLTELAIRVDRQRFAPVVYCLAGRPKREGASCAPELEAARVPVHFLGGERIWQFPFVVRRLRRLFASQKPQIVQTFLFHANVVGRVAARRAGISPVVCGIRVAEHKSRWHLWADRVTQRWVDRYVCVSQSVADFSTERGGLPPEKLVVIPNGIDLGRWTNRQPVDRAELGITAGRRIVAFVGRLEAQKGPQWLIETAPQWLAKLPDCDLLLIGEGPLLQRLEIACQSSGIAGRVHFAGWRSDVPGILAAANLLVLASAWEGMPNIVLEAMAAGRPVVATDVEGVRELLGPAAVAQTVPYGDSETLISKILSFMQDPSAAAAIGSQNRRRAEEKFEISWMVKAYERLWESLAEG